MASRNRPLNVQIRVASQGGWLAIFRGESQGSALERVLPELERDGYRVAFIVPDSFSLGKKLLNFLRALVTLGFSYEVQGLLIIGERIDGERGSDDA